MTWVGVGNVEAVLVRAPEAPGCDEALATRGGIIGYRLPRLVSHTLVVARGDTLALASDGIRHGFRIALTATAEPQELADRILSGWSTGHDDACVLVARYLGAAA
jgi:negative regulator of sigma-B (phosphoserine phosphatase)